MPGPVVLFAGRLTDGKGLGMLMDAVPHMLRTVPEATLVVAGGGDQSSYRMRAAAHMCSFGVRFAGYVPNDVLLALMRRVAVVAAPSLHHEPLGRVLLEAISVGVPVVATPYGGTPEVIKHGENGLLIDPVDAESLATAITGAITSRGLRESTAIYTAGLRNGVLHPQRAVAHTLDIYEKVVAA
jgi:glycosyltransferase involved in cell wall biosynthesis